MCDGVGKIKQAKKALHRVGKKQVLGALGKNHWSVGERWVGWDANNSAKRSYFFIVEAEDNSCVYR